MGTYIGFSNTIGASMGTLLNQTPDYFLDGTQFDNGKVILQFDDGYADNLDALDLLTEKNVKATFYYKGNFMGQAGALSWAQVLSLHNAGMDIQCHTYSYGDMTAGTDAEITTDLASLVTAFTSNGLPAPEHIAYPAGLHDDNVIEVISGLRLTGRAVSNYSYQQNGYINRKSGRFSLPAYGLPGYGLSTAVAKAQMDYAKANNVAVMLFGHHVGTVDTGYISLAQLEELIDYGQSIGIDFITTKQFYELLFYIDLTLSRNTDADKINVLCRNRLEAGYSISIERGTNGVDFTEITTLAPGVSEYLDSGLTADTNYFYRVRGFKDAEYLPYSQIEVTSTPMVFPLTSTGTGAGVATLRIMALNDCTLTLSDAGRFYTNSSGTTGESTSIKLIANTLKTTYIKVTSGSSNLTLSKNNICQINGWVSSTNAPSLGGDIGRLRKLTYLDVTGNNTISGDISNLIMLTRINIATGNTLSGSITNMPMLNYLEAPGANTITGDITNLIHLTRLSGGLNTNISGSINLLTGLTYIQLYLTSISGNLDNCPGLTRIYVASNHTLSGDLKIQSATLTYVYISGGRIVNYSAGGNWGALLANGTLQIDPAVGYGLSSDEVDLLIIEAEATRVADRRINITLRGSNAARTSASDAARAAIIADLGTVVTN